MTDLNAEKKTPVEEEMTDTKQEYIYFLILALHLNAVTVIFPTNHIQTVV